MAQVASNFDFTGPLGNLTAYKMRGIDKTILRTKGGATKEKIKTHPNFRVTRLQNAEFGGRSALSKRIREMLWPQPALADFNISGPINALIKPIQLLDKENPLGKRNIIISENPHLLEGFNLNRRAPIDSIIRSPLLGLVFRDTKSARLKIHELVPGINFFVPGKYPFFSITAVLGIVPDLFFSEAGYKPSSKAYDDLGPLESSTEWHSVMEGAEATELDLQLTNGAPDESFSLMLSVGIRFGTIGIGGAIQQIPHAGAAKILAVG